MPEVLQQGYEIYKFDTQLYDLSKYAYEIWIFIILVDNINLSSKCVFILHSTAEQ